MQFNISLPAADLLTTKANLDAAVIPEFIRCAIWELVRQYADATAITVTASGNDESGSGYVGTTFTVDVRNTSA